MSNRGRQNVASFLTQNLGIDWRLGAEHFEELLNDYDVCSNWGNWLFAAGITGGRVNVFNILKQSGDYDANGASNETLLLAARCGVRQADAVLAHVARPAALYLMRCSRT